MITITTTTPAEAAEAEDLARQLPPGRTWEIYLLGNRFASNTSGFRYVPGDGGS